MQERHNSIANQLELRLPYTNPSKCQWTAVAIHIQLKLANPSLDFNFTYHYSDVIMSVMQSQITSVSIVCSMVCLGTDQRKLQSSASLAFVWGIHRWPVNSLHKRPVTRKIFPFHDVLTMTDFLDRRASYWCKTTIMIWKGVQYKISVCL